MERGCRNCMWLYHMVTYNPTAPCSECLDYDKWQTAKRTNADRIRAKTDEELAKTMHSTGDCPPRECPYAYADLSENGGNITDKQCVECWLDWLRQEANDET